MSEERTSQTNGQDSEVAPSQASGPDAADPGAPEGDRSAPSPYQPKHKPLWNNVVTIGGMYLGIIALVLLLTFGLFSVVSPASNPYVDIIGFLIIPTILATGIVLMPLGILFKSWRMHRTDPSLRTTIRFPRIDLNDPKQRGVAKKAIAGLLLVMPVLGVTSYHGYHYTDSTQFCANACHAVMEPQSVAFQGSSHARVACAECHIGSGASWFVKSKLSGTRQVLAVLTDSFSRPIPPAIKHLRPAGDTCEQCHWPNKFFGAQLRQIAHFHSDEHNTRRDVEMLVYTGGADVSTGRAEGIHKHMLMAGTIEYVATDDKLQVIPWVRWVDHLGAELIYRADGLPATSPPPNGQRREMDCMDCHNRPAHKFRSPDAAVNSFLEAGNIDTTLPYIKREAVRALSIPYSDDETARLRIVNRIIDFYRTNYPERYDADRASVRAAAEAAAQIYEKNFFPYMKVDWRTYPDNIGHLESPGCFRCHEGKHVNQYGTPISHECGVCHTFLNTVHTESAENLISKGEFRHPYELDEVHGTLRCDRCHTGGVTPEPTCTACHADVQGLYAGSAAVFDRFDIPANPMAEDVACADCHDLSAPLTRAAINALCLDCHEDEEEAYEGMLDAWDTAIAAAQARAADAIAGLAELLADADAESAVDARATLRADRQTLESLERANALHNPDAAIRTLDLITLEAEGLADALRPGLSGATSTE